MIDTDERERERDDRGDVGWCVKLLHVLRNGGVLNFYIDVLAIFASSSGASSCVTAGIDDDSKDVFVLFVIPRKRACHLVCV